MDGRAQPGGILPGEHVAQGGDALALRRLAKGDHRRGPHPVVLVGEEGRELAPFGIVEETGQRLHGVRPDPGRPVVQVPSQTGKETAIVHAAHRGEEEGKDPLVPLDLDPLEETDRPRLVLAAGDLLHRLHAGGRVGRIEVFPGEGVVFHGGPHEGLGRHVFHGGSSAFPAPSGLAGEAVPGLAVAAPGMGDETAEGGPPDSLFAVVEKRLEQGHQRSMSEESHSAGRGFALPGTGRRGHAPQKGVQVLPAEPLQVEETPSANGESHVGEGAHEVGVGDDLSRQEEPVARGATNLRCVVGEMAHEDRDGPALTGRSEGDEGGARHVEVVRPGENPFQRGVETGTAKGAQGGHQPDELAPRRKGIPLEKGLEALDGEGGLPAVRGEGFHRRGRPDPILEPSEDLLPPREDAAVALAREGELEEARRTGVSRPAEGDHGTLAHRLGRAAQGLQGLDEGGRHGASSGP